MFQVSASVLQSQRADHANSASIEAINQFATAVAHGISKGMNSFSIGNNGAEYSILDIISTAPLPTYRQSYITATRTFLAHCNATIIPQLTKSFISEWSWPRDSIVSNSTLLAAFSSLTPHYDSQQVQYHKTKLAAVVDWSDSARLNYSNLVTAAAAPVLDRSLEMASMAFENFIFLLSIVNNMRFKFQDALLKALYRTDAWIGPKLFRLGKKSLRAMDFITFVYGQLATELDYIMRRMANADSSCTEVFLRAIECVPDMSEDSILSCEYAIYFQAANAAKVTLSSLSSPRIPTTDQEKERLKDKKKALGKSNQSSKPASLGTSTTSVPTGQRVVPSAGQQTSQQQQSTTGQNTGHCFYFNTTAGCTSTGCIRPHEVPKKGSHFKLRELFKKWASMRSMKMNDSFMAED